MRILRVLSIMAAAASAALAGCEQATAPVVAALGGTTSAAGSLAISPGRATLNAGTTLQLATNAPLAQQNQIQWGSSNTTVATISPSGLVNAVAAGTTTITARYSTDTTRVATATIDVIGAAGTTGSNPTTP
jgi:uncharacterized protein YjdB